MSARKKRKPPVSKPRDKMLVKRMETAREHVFWAGAIVDCCAYATDSLLIAKDGRPNLQCALQAAYELLEKAAGAVSDALEGAPASEGEL